MSSEIVVSKEQQGVGELWRRATDVAGAIREFVLGSGIVTIQGKRYPKVEAWMAAATAFGCVASARDVEVVEGGIRAIGEVRRLSDGLVLSTAEGFVGDDEKMWASRPLYARRAMAQTRAISRACRSALAFVIPLIDANLATTPAEEMDFVQGEVVANADKAEALKAQLSQPKPAAKPVAAKGVVLSFPNYGRNKGGAIAGASAKDLDFYEAGAVKNLADPSKSRFHASEQVLLEAIRAERARQASGAPVPAPVVEDGPPPHGDEDAPF